MKALELQLDQMFDAGKQHTTEYKKLHKQLIQMQCEQQWESYENPLKDRDAFIYGWAWQTTPTCG